MIVGSILLLLLLLRYSETPVIRRFWANKEGSVPDVEGGEEHILERMSDIMKPQNIKNQCVNLARNTIKILNDLRVYIGIRSITHISEGFILGGVTLKHNTRIDGLIRAEKDLRLRLGLPTVQIHQTGSSVYIFVSHKESPDNRLIRVLKHPDYTRNQERQGCRTKPYGRI